MLLKKPPAFFKMPLPATLTAIKPEDASISECHTHFWIKIHIKKI